MASRVGKNPVPVPSGVQVSREGRSVRVKGPKGELVFTIRPGVDVAVEQSRIVVTQKSASKQALALHGTTRAILANMVTGVSKGFQKSLEIQGTGYRAQMSGKNLSLQVGYSHSVDFEPPAGVTLAIDGPTKVIVTGFDKQAVGQVAAEIRGIRPPEPYKGKGIRYAGEYVRRKAGKAAGGKTA